MEYTVYLTHSTKMIKGGVKKVVSAYLIEFDNAIIKVEALNGISTNISLLQALSKALVYIPERVELNISTNSRYLQCALTIPNYAQVAKELLDEIKSKLKNINWRIVNMSARIFHSICKEACNDELSKYSVPEKKGVVPSCTIQIMGDYKSTKKGFFVAVSYIFDKELNGERIHKSNTNIYVYKKIKNCVAETLCCALRHAEKDDVIKIISNSTFIRDFFIDGVCFTDEKSLESRCLKLGGKAKKMIFNFSKFDGDNLLRTINNKALEKFLKEY